MAFFNVNGYIALILFAAVLRGRLRLSVGDSARGPGKARFVREMFSRIARRYDLMNGLMTFGMHHAWRRGRGARDHPAARGAGAGPGHGHGRSRARARARIHPHRVVVGADFAHGMLSVARGEAPANGAGGRVRLVGGRRARPALRDARLRLRDVGLPPAQPGRPRAGLAEMRRVTAPGGRVVALEITQADAAAAGRRSSAPTSTTWSRASARSWAATARPTPICRSRSTASSRRPSSAALMEDVGLRDVTYRRLGLGTVAIHTGIA